MAPLLLYHFALSAPSRIALLAIRNLNIEVEIIEVDLSKKDQLGDDFVKINPQHVVPTIDDDGFILWESRAIAQYLFETRDPDGPLYPKDPKKRALVNQRLQFDLGTFHPRLRAIAHPAMFEGATTIPPIRRKQLTEAFQLLEEFLNNSTWFAGESVTLADLSILATLSSIVHAGADISVYPKLSAWYDQCKSLPGYEENEAGAKLYGDRLKALLTEKL